MVWEDIKDVNLLFQVKPKMMMIFTATIFDLVEKMP